MAKNKIPVGASVEHFKKFDVSESRVKVALNAYSFTKSLNDYIKGRTRDPMTLFDLIDFCSANDIEALDATGYFFVGYPNVPVDDYIYEVKRYAFRRGVDIAGTGVTNNFANPDIEARRKDVERVKDWIDVASKLGAPVLQAITELLWSLTPQLPLHSFEDIADLNGVSNRMHLCKCPTDHRHHRRQMSDIQIHDHGDLIFRKQSHDCFILVNAKHLTSVTVRPPDQKSFHMLEPACILHLPDGAADRHNIQITGF